MKTFEYVAPKTLRKALDLVSEHGAKAKVLAGGTDLINDWRNKVAHPDILIDLKQIPGLAGIRENARSGLAIGALTTVREIETSPVIKQMYPCLSYAAGTLGSVQVRNKATIGGNICHATPSADTLPSLIALGATVKFAGKDGKKTGTLEDFFKGPGKTVLDNEILTEIDIPKLPDNTAGAYIKFSPRKAMDLAVVGVAAVITTDDSFTTCQDIKIVLGAVAPTPMRARKAEALLKGKKLTTELIGQAASAAAQEARPITDIRASEWYRRQIVEVLTQRSINQALSYLKGSK